MEEIFPEKNKNIGDVCKEMYVMVANDHTPVTGLVQGVRIIMFEEKKEEDPHYDGPR
jgi:hypothetical protein